MFVGALAFSQFLAITGFINQITDLVLGLPLSPMMMFISMQLILFVIHMFLDSLACLLITIPLFMPVVTALGFDPLWFGIIYLINLVLGMITPPVGMVLFTAVGVIPDVSTDDVYRASIPFIIITLIIIILLVIFPEITLWLPRMLGL